ncbi:MAG TPA: hypothetical protein VGI39_16130 [Polyangiaceae bacterium]
MPRPSRLGGALLFLLACHKPVPGEPCKREGDVACLAPRTAAVCVDARWETEGCNGASGCVSLGVFGGGSCATDGHQEGEPCEGQEGNPACASDKKAVLVCAAKHWKKTEDCAGERGCTSVPGGTHCDQGTQPEGARCSAQSEGSGACTPDRRKLLQCKNGVLVVVSVCGGPGGCHQTGDHLDCDEGASLPSP